VTEGAGDFDCGNGMERAGERILIKECSLQSSQI
jgi:hypothetical protein